MRTNSKQWEKIKLKAMELEDVQSFTYLGRIHWPEKQQQGTLAKDRTRVHPDRNRQRREHLTRPGRTWSGFRRVKGGKASENLEVSDK